MRSIRVQDGDIQVSTGRTLEFVYDRDKLLQDLELWLREPLGTGFSTREFGSTLDDLIGHEDPQEATTLVSAEIVRVLKLYQRVQLDRLREARNLGLLHQWSKREILSNILSVECTVEYDTVRAHVMVETLAGSPIDVEIYVSSEGVRLNV